MQGLLISPDSEVGFEGTPVVYAEDKRYSRKVIARDRNGKEYERVEHPIVWLCRTGNIVVDLGRKNALKQAFGISGTTTFGYGSVGDDAGVIITSADYTATHLGNEIILADGTYTGRRPIVSLDDDALADGDFTLSPSGGNRYRVPVKFDFPEDHPSNGETMAEFGIHSSATFPVSGGATSGVMLARFVPTTSFDKDEAFAVTMKWTLRS